MDYRSEAPKILRDFLSYHENIKGHSRGTVDEYYLDLRMFLRFLKLSRGLVPRAQELDEIDIADVDLSFVSAVTLTEVYEYLTFLSRDKIKNPRSRDAEYGLSAKSRARRFAAIRSFYKYLTAKPNFSARIPCRIWTLPRYRALCPAF
jgi:site-specific recombinase XerD